MKMLINRLLKVEKEVYFIIIYNFIYFKKNKGKPAVVS